MDCIYTRTVWAEIGKKIKFVNLWKEVHVELCLKEWSIKEELNYYRYLPLIVSWSTWNSMNYCCFEDEFVLLIQCAYQSIGIIRYFPQENAQIKTRLAVEEEIDVALPWGYFYGVVQRDPKS